MTLARTLPADLAPRFAGAARAALRTDTTSFELVVAEGFVLRLRGLAGLDAGQAVPLLFPRCRSIHTFGMRAAIDVVWIDWAPDGRGDVVAVEANVPRRRIARSPGGADRRRVAALELAAGDAGALGLAPGARAEISRGP